jgi:hypothetical protein
VPVDNLLITCHFLQAVLDSVVTRAMYDTGEIARAKEGLAALEGLVLQQREEHDA